MCRFLKGSPFCKRVHGMLAEHETDVISYFWRGVGRSLYFTAANFVPTVGPARRAIRLAAAEAPSIEWRDTLLAGVVWALLLVNMHTPAVLEYVLENPDAYGCASPAFDNGIMCAIVMRYDTDTDDPFIDRLRGHRPGKRVRPAWESLIKPALDFAIGVAHPVLKRHRRLEEVFRTPSLRCLVATLSV